MFLFVVECMSSTNASPCFGFRKAMSFCFVFFAQGMQPPSVPITYFLHLLDLRDATYSLLTSVKLVVASVFQDTFLSSTLAAVIVGIISRWHGFDNLYVFWLRDFFPCKSLIEKVSTTPLHLQYLTHFWLLRRSSRRRLDRGVNFMSKLHRGWFFIYLFIFLMARMAPSGY